MLSPVIAKNVGDVFLRHSVNIDGLSAVQTHHQLVVVRQWSDITPSTTHHRQNLLMTCGLRHSDDDDAGWETWHSAGHCLLKLRETCSYVARLSTVWYVCVRARVCVYVWNSHVHNCSVLRVVRFRLWRTAALMTSAQVNCISMLLLIIYASTHLLTSLLSTNHLLSHFIIMISATTAAAVTLAVAETTSSTAKSITRGLF